MGVKSCDNCGVKGCSKSMSDEPCFAWERIECPNCGGALSELRFHRGKSYRHCYSCHFEYYKEETE